MKWHGIAIKFQFGIIQEEAAGPEVKWLLEKQHEHHWTSATARKSFSYFQQSAIESFHKFLLDIKDSVDRILSFKK